MTGDPLSFLVSAQWLSEHLVDDNLIVLDASIVREVDVAGTTHFARGSNAFAAGPRIPGARFADVIDGFSDPEGAFPFTRPTAAHLQSTARALGINDNTTVIVYDRLSGAWAARVWWVLSAFGHHNVFVLDGGFRAWTAQGLPQEAGFPAASSTTADTTTTATATATAGTAGTFTAVPQPGYFVDVPETLAAAEHRSPAAPRSISAPRSTTRLVCALRREEFEGNPHSNSRTGHIPGSINLPYAELLDDDGLVDIPAVIAQAHKLELDAAESLILYCGGGVNASGLALALGEAGIYNASIFDGSLNEWKADPALPLVTGAKP